MVVVVLVSLEKPPKLGPSCLPSGPRDERSLGIRVFRLAQRHLRTGPRWLLAVCGRGKAGVRHREKAKERESERERERERETEIDTESP